MDFKNDLEKAMEYFTTSGAFLTTKSEKGTNTMVVSWGFIGQMWAKPHVIVVVRPQRFTKQIIDGADSFTLSIPYGGMKEELKICGTKSGADIDKSKVVEFTESQKVESPVVKGCNMYYECKITYVDSFKGENLPKETADKFYDNDFHCTYFGEIVACYTA